MAQSKKRGEAMKDILRGATALATLILVACNTPIDEAVESPKNERGTLISLDLSDTRTSLGELDENNRRKLYWSEGDKIVINGSTSQEAEISESSPSSASFFFEDVELTYPYSILYPAEFYKDNATITIPAIQAKATDSFATNTLPLASYLKSNGVITMQHLAGAFRFRIKRSSAEKADVHTIQRVEFRGNNGEQLSGDFAIDYSALTLTGLSSDTADKVVYTRVEADTSLDSELNVFVVVPARSYEKGFKLRIIDTAGHYMDVVSESARTLSKGEIKVMSVVEFVPTGTLIDVEIK